MRDAIHPALAGLGAHAIAVERALEGSPIDLVHQAIGMAEHASSAPAALAAARFHLSLRGADGARSEVLAAIAIDLAAGAAKTALVIERASLVARDRARLAEADAALAALDVGDDDGLRASLWRARGSIARARGDVRASLALLEASTLAAEKSQIVREIVRTANTLGTTYASLAASGAALAALERARELAEITGLRQSAAIAAGQLAVVALDAEKPRLAATHLRAQGAIAAALGDTYGLARSTALLVEALALAEDPAGAREAATDARTIFRKSPSPWTRLQAVLATLYEAEDAYFTGDRARGDELFEGAKDELASDAPSVHVVHARSAFATLHRARFDGDVPAAIGVGLSRLRRSPRPAWVERFLRLAAAVATPSDARALALRAALLGEARAVANDGRLASLRLVAPDLASARALAHGRDVMIAARLAAAPLAPFEGHAVLFEADDAKALDDAFAIATAVAAAAFDDAFVGTFVGPGRALVAFGTIDLAAEFASKSRVVRAGPATLIVRATPEGGLALLPTSWQAR